MKTTVCSILALGTLAGAFVAGSWYNQRTTAGKNSAADRKILYYTDPMHPEYKSDKPGIAPDCGMQLEAVYADSGPAPETQPAGTVNVGAAKQQRIGVRVSAVGMESSTQTVRLLGRVAPDETRVYKLVAGADGFIRQTSAVTTGSRVAKDEWLATFSAPDLRAPIQGYLVTLDTVERQKQGGAEAPIQTRAAFESMQQARDRVLNLGMSAVQLDEIRRTQAVPTDIKIVAPAGGFVLARNVSAGQRFEKGAEWYRIADLGRVWILADAYPQDAKYIRPGQGVRVSVPGAAAVLNARISEVLPQFDANSRTLKVRLEADNPGYVLRPDMFVDVDLPVKLPPSIAVPVDAVLDSGIQKTVFVDRGEGYFEPRPVETGWRFGGQVQIVKGLAPGERIATSGNFLLDSETRLQHAANPKPVLATSTAAY